MNKMNIANETNKYNKDYSSLSDDTLIKYGTDWDMVASKKEFIEYQEKINQIRKEIYEKDLSPLERLMYAYDYVKSKTFKMSDDDSKNGLPHLTIDGDSIVCRGYCLLLNEILYEDPDIKISDVSFEVYNKEKELFDYHDRNLVIIKDEKYKIRGAYFLDPTGDSYKKEYEQVFGSDYKKTDLYGYFLRKITDEELFHTDFEYNISQLEIDDKLTIHPSFVENQEKRLEELFTLYPKEDLSYLLETTFANLFENMDIDTIRDYIFVDNLAFETLMQVVLNVRKAKGLNGEELQKEYERIARINEPFFDKKDTNVIKK